jgi:hypothetical protein
MTLTEPDSVTQRISAAYNSPKVISQLLQDVSKPRGEPREIFQPLAMRLLRGEFGDGDSILGDARDGRLDFRRAEAPIAASV